MEKIKTKDGFKEYIKAKNVNFKIDPPFKHPELNKLILETDYLVNNQMSFANQYYDNKLNEDKLRIGMGLKVVTVMENKMEKRLKALSDLRNEHLIKTFKFQTELFIDTVRSPNLHEHALNYAKTQDNMRVDLGLVISRPPIFLGVHPADMEFGKYRRSIFKKYFNDNSKYVNDLETFNDLTSEYWDVTSGIFRINKDNIPNIRKFDDATNDYKFYSGNSKHFSLVDPECDDNKSIQYEGK